MKIVITGLIISMIGLVGAIALGYAGYFAVGYAFGSTVFLVGAMTVGIGVISQLQENNDD